MRLRGTPERLMAHLVRQHPGIPDALATARERVGTSKIKREVAPYQAAALYALARGCDFESAHLLEIGTALGFSACMLAQAAPAARLTTLNPRDDEMALARAALSVFERVKPVVARSEDYITHYGGPYLDMVFVDGDHEGVAHDFPWFNWVRPGGMMVFHDYSPDGTGRPCRPVWDALNAFAAHLERDFDVHIVDDGGVGMAGWVRRNGERAP